MTLAELRRSWTEDGQSWDKDRKLATTRQAIALSDMHLAIDIIRSAIAEFGDDAVCQYYLTLAYANSGSREEVFRHLEHLIETINPDHPYYVNALCLLGRVEKDRYFRAPEADTAQTALINALEAYHAAFEHSHGSFPGINAATLFLLAGDKETAQSIAASLITDNASDQNELWQMATLAEAHLIREEFDSALHYYSEVVAQAGNNFGQLAAIKRHLPFISNVIRVPSAIHNILGGPVIAIFSGHMLDTKDRQTARFPASIRELVATEIGKQIDSYDVRIGYSSAACGGDLIFAREMLKRGREIHIILPFEADEFRCHSVKLDGVDESLEFWDVIDKATSVTIATNESHLNNPCLYTYAADLIEGYAQLRAKQCDGTIVVLTAIDPHATGQPGGSMERVMTWLDAGLDIQVIDLAKLRGDENAEFKVPARSKKPDKRHLDREVKSVVEVVTQSDEKKVVFDAIKKRVPDEAAYLRGGGLSRAFNQVSEAAAYAYRVRAAANLIQWPTLGLPADTNVQIAIHTGPIFPRSQTAERDYFGTHVFYTRDLALHTPPGSIYLTEPAAALLETHGVTGYTSDYLGSMDVKQAPRHIYRLQKN